MPFIVVGLPVNYFLEISGSATGNLEFFSTKLLSFVLDGNVVL